MPVLRYGTDTSVDLDFASGVQPSLCGTPRGEPLADVPAAVVTALDEPIDYPALRHSTTPGDRVVLALAPGVPQVAEVTAALIHALVEYGVEPDGISVLRTEADVLAGAGDPLRFLDASLVERVRLVTHDPNHRNGLAYLAATESGDPILLNRLLTDADLVVPVGCVRRKNSAGYFGIHTGIFPAFSDRETQARFRRSETQVGTGHRRSKMQDEVNHVAWLLGAIFSIQLIPAAGGDRVLHILAGESEAIRSRCRELYDLAWHSPVAYRASLVVAAIEGSTRQQTWESFGLALEAAEQLVDEDGAIAVCCDLATLPGPAMQRMIGSRNRETALRYIHRDNPVDALAATQLARVLDRNHVYLLSQLDPGLVEEMEMIPIAGPNELIRLTEHHDSCILLANAPQAAVSLENE